MMQPRSEVLRKGKDLPKQTRLSGPEAAEHLAIQALAFIAAEPERLGGFLAATGIGPADLRSAAHEPHFLAGVLDYLASDEPLLLAFADHADMDAVTVMFAREVLGGPPRENDDL
jgi:hypothetical protein